MGFIVLDFTIFKQIFFENSDRAGYSDLNPSDGGQSLYPMGTVFVIFSAWYILEVDLKGVGNKDLLALHPQDRLVYDKKVL